MFKCYIVLLTPTEAYFRSKFRKQQNLWNQNQFIVIRSQWKLNDRIAFENNVLICVCSPYCKMSLCMQPWADFYKQLFYQHILGYRPFNTICRWGVFLVSHGRNSDSNCCLLSEGKPSLHVYWSWLLTHMLLFFCTPYLTWHRYVCSKGIQS